MWWRQVTIETIKNSPLMWTEENTEKVLAGSLSWARFFCCHRRSEIGLLVSTFTESRSRGKKVVVLVQMCCFERALWSWRDSDCPVNWAIRKQVVNNQLSKCKVVYCCSVRVSHSEVFLLFKDAAWFWTLMRSVLRSYTRSFSSAAASLLKTVWRKKNVGLVLLGKFRYNESKKKRLLMITFTLICPSQTCCALRVQSHFLWRCPAVERIQLTGNTKLLHLKAF